MNRSLTLRTGQCHVQRYMKPLLDRIERGELDPTRIITHTLPLDQAERGFEIFKNKQDNCEKVVLKPVKRHRHFSKKTTMDLRPARSGSR